MMVCGRFPNLIMRSPSKSLLASLALITPSSSSCYLTSSFINNIGAPSKQKKLYMTNSNMSKIPAPPFTYLSGEKQILDLTDLNALIAKNEAVKQEAYDLSSKIKTALMKHRASIEKNVTSEERAVLRADLDALIQQALQQHQDHHNGNGDRNDNMKNTRLANLSFTFGDFVRQKAYMHFLETGTLLPQSSLDAALSDEEYLSGIISMNHDISRYVIGKGTARDAQSVMLARDLISSVLDHLMKYDFRNGNLRRKYDAVKYALKTCETVLYELSVTGCEFPTEGEEPPAKRSKATNDNILPEDELEDLRKRMVLRDELRENLIKKCRDGQKAAKQAIYALHREDFKKAEKLIADCEKCILEELTPIVDKEPQLRYGSFANVLEEYAEAKLFYEWLGNDVETPAGVVLAPTDFTVIPLEPEEYLGGIADLTGEIGRFAVKRGTIRDTKNVKLSLETVMCILYAFESLCKLPGHCRGKRHDY